MVVFNRLLAILFGLLLLAIGVTGLTLGLGTLGPRFADMTPLPAAIAKHAMAPTDNDLIGLALLGLLALLLGLLLLRAELRVRAQSRMRDLRYVQSSAEQALGRGRTVVRTGGLEHGLRLSLGALPGIHWAHAQLAGSPERPNLLIELEVDAEARLSTLKSEVGRAIERFQLTSGRQPSTQVRIRLAEARRSVD
jgi:type II secretory pathway pseudopilin PulG